MTTLLIQKRCEQLGLQQSELLKSELKLVKLEVDFLKLQLELHNIELRNQRDAAAGALWDRVKRVRTGVKSVFRDNLSADEVVGGTRMGDRKPRTLKKKEPVAR